MPIPLRVLILEDREADAELMLAALRQADFDPAWRRVATERDYLTCLDPALDLILADYSLPSFDALRALRRLQDRELDIPFIVVTGAVSEEAAVECMKQGATDYLLKDRLARLGAAVTQALEQVQLREAKRRADQEVRESERRFRDLLDTAPDAIVIADDTGRIVLVNSEMERLFGYRRHEVLGQPEGLLLPTEHRQATASRAMAPGQELIARRKDGSEVAVEVTLGTLPTAAGTLTIRVIRDITERKRMEAVLRAKSEELAAMTQQLWQVGRLATVGELAASIAHELNNPLAIVSLRIEGLLRRFPEGDASRRPLEIIDQEVERMSVLVGNLLNFSRRGERQLSALDVREELDRTLELMENHLRNRRIVVVRDFSAVPIMVRADRQQLRQVFLNLFVNAGDAMPGGGTLTVSVRAETDASTRRVNTVEVVDTGVGIAPEDLPRVTEPFFTTKPEGKGTGLGLALCRRIVQEHAGTFEMRSEPGLGTTVRIALPTMNGGSALDSGAREIAS